MTPAARLSAAIELIDTIDTQRVPAAKALKEWGTAHRYAGSGDRAAISGLVWDVLRRRASSAWLNWSRLRLSTAATSGVRLSIWIDTLPSAWEMEIFKPSKVFEFN